MDQLTMTDDEKRTRQLNAISGIAIAALLITVAWGNAIAMFAVSAIILVVMFLFSGKLAGKGIVTVAAACCVAFLVAVLVQNL